MTDRDRPSQEPVAAHAYMLPVVREVPSGIAPSAASASSAAVPQAAAYAADAHAW